MPTLKPPLRDTDHLLEEVVKIAVDYLADHADRQRSVIRHLTPEDLQDRFAMAPPTNGRSPEELLEEIRKVLHYSVRTGHPGFCNQLYGGYDTAALIGEWVTALLNTSMYTYEVAPVFTLMERALIRHMCEFVGWAADEGEGVFTPGGSIANLMALLAARNRFLPHVKQDGLEASDHLILFASKEAHYSVLRAASVAGLGTTAVRQIPVDELGRMRPEALEDAIRANEGQQSRPFFVCATAGTTVAGAFDPIDEIAEIAENHSMWLHVDASYGGSVLLSDQHRSLMRGCERADSVTWNPHKMMGIPFVCSALLVREKGRLAATNGMQADYLFHANEDAEYNLGDLSLQCGRRVDALKLWLSWHALGDDGHAHRIDHLFELAGALRNMVVERRGFELVREPEGLNVCFHFVPESVSESTNGAARSERLGKATMEIRELLRRSGQVLVNYAPLAGVPVFRYVASNHRATEEDLRFMLDEIERFGSGLK